MEGILLTDLDTLLLKVRDNNSLDYIQEAVKSYRNGAYRAAIISTWVALTYDLIAKIRELAANDNKAAIAIITDIDKAIDTNDIKKFLNIENEILEKSLFLELISQSEKFLLTNIKDARNFCAHPSFDKQDGLFKPSAELVRSHIVHSLQLVLTQKPIQGSFALKAFVTDISSAAFPANESEIQSFLKSKYLNRSKQSFIRNAVIILLKSIIKNSVSELAAVNDKAILVLKFFLKEKYDETMAVLKEKVNQLISTSEPSTFVNYLKILAIDYELISVLDKEHRITLTTIITQNINNVLYEPFLYKSLKCPELKDEIVFSVKTQKDRDKFAILSEHHHSELTDVAIDFFLASNRFTETRDRGFHIILEIAPKLKVTQLRKLLEGMPENTDIYRYVNFDNIVKDLYAKTEHLLEYSREHWQSFCNSTNVINNEHLQTFMITNGYKKEGTE